MKTKHTPGPWTVDEVEQDGKVISRGIFDVHGIGLNKGSEFELFSRADAALMALAPELLEACELFMDAWIQDEERNMHQLRQDMDEAYSRAKTAIAKAKGESNCKI